MSPGEKMRRTAVPLFGLLLAVAAALPEKDDWDIYSFHIVSTVTGRYATTVITSRVANLMDESKEIEFHVQIPKNAFISKFRMVIDGEVYDGVVKTKEQAWREYTQAVSRGQSAGIVSSVGRTMEEFKTSVNVAAHKKVTFELTYEELLKRTHGKYELQIHARPMKPVRDFKVDVYIYEKAGIGFVDVKGGLSTNALANAINKTHVDKQAWVNFYPTEDEQKSCDSCGEHGMNGDLVIVYDVNRDNGLGDIKTSDGYFVHHFAPSNLTRIPKNVVFVIDRSGSMHGRKMEQTRTALLHILNDLAEDDFFGLISFDSQVFHWKRELVQATSANLEGAKEFARNIHDRGSTDINAAVLEGARMLNAHPREGSASILILLTDGDPTSGVTNLEQIQSNVKQAIAEKYPLYCLGFGFDVSFEFLEKMSLHNNGVARRIYEDSDADLQLKGFYEEVATPLLTDVTMNYVGGTNLTQTNFSQYYNGSEIVVAGEIVDNNIETFIPQVVAISSKRKVTFSRTTGPTESSTGTVADGLLQRVWAYLTVKQLLEKELLLSGPEREKVREETLKLSLKYSFVTPLTSMVVTKPEGENTDILHKPKEGDVPPPSPGQSFIHSAGLPALKAHLSHDHAPPNDHLSSSYILHTVQTISMDYEEVDSVPPLRAPVLPWKPTFAPASHIFLLKSKNPSPPLCFRISGIVLLKLLHHPSKAVYVNGELDSDIGGFSKIFIHAGSDQHLEVYPDRFDARRGQTTIQQTSNNLVTTGSITATRRSDEEFDIAVEDVRLVLFIHEKDGNRFLWPVLQQRPSANNTEGILSLKPVDYEEVQSSSSTTVRIKDREISVISADGIDYSINKPVPQRCWLTLDDDDVPLEKPWSNYILTQL